jgi:hypothetical protein
MSSTLIVVGVFACLSGAIFGSSIRTQTEWKARRGAPGWQPFNGATPVGIALNQVFWLVCVAVLCALVVAIPLRAAAAYPLSGQASQVLGAAWLGGAAVGKLARYLYWRRRL